MQTDHPFWLFSISFYANPQVKAGCLRLQEEAGGNVNLLLFSLWLATERREFDCQHILENEEFTYWHEQVVLPLRQARTAIKSTGENACYEQAKQLELQAERVEQNLLYELLTLFVEVPAAQSIEQLVERNLMTYLTSLSLGREQVEVFVELFSKLLAEGYCRR